MTRIDTTLIHAGEPSPRIGGAVAMPIFQSSTFEYGGERDYHDVRYIRLNNTPNHLALHAKLAALEGAEAALVTASGMAAVSTALLALLGHGDHLLIQSHLYGGTHDFVTKDLPRFGVTYDFIDAERPESWERKLRPTTRLIYAETLSNPTLHVPDLAALIGFARRHELVSMIDNTFASPINYAAVRHGFDLSLHSCTKYLNGHSDIVAGAVIGRAALVERIKRTLDHLGGTLDPHACFLLHRGMKTLAVRVRHQNDSALRIARALAEHAGVSAVHHPGLPTHASHDRAREHLAGAGGTFSFVPRGGVEKADTVLRKVRYFLSAPSLGGVESLITRPATTSHAGLSSEERRALGLPDELIRISVGLEAAEDLIEDLRQALE